MKHLVIQAMLIKINKEISLQSFIPLSDAEKQGLLHPAQANLGYFLDGVSVSTAALNAV
jgi:hypothetical protein